MSKIIAIFLSFVFLFPIKSLAYHGGDAPVDPGCTRIDDHNVSCGSSSKAGIALLVLGGGWLIFNSNAFQGMKDEEKAEFINDLNKGKGMKIKGFDSGVSMYLLPNSQRIDERFENNLNFSESGFETRPNILSLEYNF